MFAIVSSLEGKSYDERDDFAAIRLLEETKENIWKVFVWWT